MSIKVNVRRYTAISLVKFHRQLYLGLIKTKCWHLLAGLQKSARGLRDKHVWGPLVYIIKKMSANYLYDGRYLYNF